MLSLRVALAGGELIDTVAVPRHAVGPELTQLFVGSEGTLGIITRATLELVPLPAERRFVDRCTFPNVEAGIERLPPRRCTPATGRRSSACTTRRRPRARSRPSSARRWTASAPSSASRARRRPSPLEGRRTRRARARGGRARARPGARPALVGPPLRLLQPAPPPRAAGDLGHDRRRRDLHAHRRRLRRARSRGARAATPTQGLQLRMHFSHWYRWGTMIYAPLRGPRRRRRTRSRCTTASGTTASPPCSTPAA